LNSARHDIGTSAGPEGNSAKAVDLLAPVYAGHRGFDTADLERGKALLDQLA